MDNEINHVDFLNQPLAVGDIVVANVVGFKLGIFKVTGLTNKMVRVANLHAKTDRCKKGKLRYGEELCKIDSQLLTYFLMKN